jgi:tetratricopeptide (TPR) repeat protein
MEQTSRYKEAETNLKPLLAKDPHHVGALFRMASVQENMNQWDQAIQYYQQALVQNPQHLSALYNLAQLQMSHKKDKPAAIKAWKQYIAVAGKIKGQESFIKDAQKQLKNLEGGAS